MEEVRAQDSSFLTGKELKAILNAKRKAESDVVRRRNIRAAKRAPYNLKAGARKCNSRVDGVKQRPSKDPKKGELEILNEILKWKKGPKTLVGGGYALPLDWDTSAINGAHGGCVRNDDV